MGQFRRTTSAVSLTRMEEAMRKSKEGHSTSPMLEFPPSVTNSPTSGGLKSSVSSPDIKTSISTTTAIAPIAKSTSASSTASSASRTTSMFAPLKLWAEKLRTSPTTSSSSSKTHFSMTPPTKKHGSSITASPRTTPRGPKMIGPVVREVAPRSGSRSLIDKDRRDSEASLASVTTATGESSSSLVHHCFAGSPLLQPSDHTVDDLSPLDRSVASKNSPISVIGYQPIIINAEGVSEETPHTSNHSEEGQAEGSTKEATAPLQPPKRKGILKPYQPSRQSARFGFSYNKKCDGGAAMRRGSTNHNDEASPPTSNDAKRVSFGTELYTTVYHYEHVDVPKHMAPWLNTKGLKEILFGKGKATHPLIIANSMAHDQQASSDEEAKVPPVVEYCEKVMIPLPTLGSFSDDVHFNGTDGTTRERGEDEGMSLEELKASFEKSGRSEGSGDRLTSSTVYKSSSFSPVSSASPRTPRKSSSARPSSKSKGKNGVPKKVRMPENFSFMAHRMM